MQTTSYGAAQLLGLLSQPSGTNPAQTLVLVVAGGSLTAHILFSVQQTLIPLNLHTQFSLECSRQYGWALELQVVNYTNNPLIACVLKWSEPANVATICSITSETEG